MKRFPLLPAVLLAAVVSRDGCAGSSDTGTSSSAAASTSAEPEVDPVVQTLIDM
jgi:hypothetical protein